MGWPIRISLKPFLFTVASLLIFSVFVSSQKSSMASATGEASPWLAAETPSVKNLKENIPFEEMPLYVDGNQECIIQKKFITRPAKKIILQSEQSYNSCGVDTLFGTIEKTNRLTRLGTNISGEVYYPNNFKVKLSPLPNSDDALSLDFNAPSGAYINIERGIGHRLTTQVDGLTGEIKHILSNGTSQTVKDELSNKLFGRLDARGVSGNGKWVVFDAIGIGLVRLNVDTGGISIFAPGYTYGIGQDPLLEYAVSNDGRYVAVSAVAASLSFKIYDLDNCAKSSLLNKPATCQFRDLKPILQSIMPDHLGIGTKISFIDNYNLKLYGTTLKNGVRTRYVQLLTATGHAPVEFPYLALGDSFASGEGARDYKAGTDVKNPKNKCHISVKSYPYLIGEELGLNLFQSIACSGAKIKDINGQYLSRYQEQDPQSFEKTDVGFNNEILDNFLPGYRMQKDFVFKYKPDKITLSISGNDMGFGNIVRNCVFWPDTCYSKPLERAELIKTVNDRFPELVKMYAQLKESSPGSDIYVIGYPRMVNPDGPCEPNVQANKDELKFFNNLADYINSVIKKAADNAGVYYVDIADALNGHRLCESSVAEFAVNGLTLGNDKVFDIGPIGNESYHPNALGHELIEKAILEKTNNFAARNSAPKVVPLPTIADAKDFIGSNVYDALDINFFNKSDVIDSWWTKNQEQSLNAEGFAPNSSVEVKLTSDPISLGVFSSDSDGAISDTLTLPDSVPVGYHTLHIAGKNVAGENIEYRQEVFVADYETDSDGEIGEPQPVLPVEGETFQDDNTITEPIAETPTDESSDNIVPDPTPPSENIPIPTGFPADDENPIEVTPPLDDTTSTDIIDSVDSQNQNVVSVQPQQSAIGPQAQVSTIPETVLNSQSQGTGTQAILFGSDTGSALLLNQSQVLSTSSQAASTQPTQTPVPLQKSNGLPVGPILIILIILLALAVFFRLRGKKQQAD